MAMTQKLDAEARKTIPARLPGSSRIPRNASSREAGVASRSSSIIAAPALTSTSAFFR